MIGAHDLGEGLQVWNYERRKPVVLFDQVIGQFTSMSDYVRVVPKLYHLLTSRERVEI